MATRAYSCAYTSANYHALQQTQLQEVRATSFYRYVAMAKLTKEREEILTRHITQATYPPSDNWGARCLSKALAARRSLKPCGGSSNSKAYSSAARWQLTPDSETLNIVLLGTDGLAHDLANAITVRTVCRILLVICVRLLCSDLQ